MFTIKSLQLAGLALLTGACLAQSPAAGPDSDPVFSVYLPRLLTYPIDAEKAGAYGKIYAGFTVDAKGHLQNVATLNPELIGYGFEKEVLKKIRRLPAVSARYEGTYALPIVFAFVDLDKSTDEVRPAGNLPDRYLAGRTLLAEIKVVGYSKIPQRRKTYLLWDAQKIR